MFRSRIVTPVMLVALHVPLMLLANHPGSAAPLRQAVGGTAADGMSRHRLLA